MRLAFATDQDLPQLQRLFDSNLAYLRIAGEVLPDAVGIADDHACRYMTAETSLPGGRCLVAVDGEDVVATVALVVPHPNEPYPWIGLLLVEGARQGRGIGGCVADAVEKLLSEEGWSEVRLAVLEANSAAYRFWARQGYSSYDEGEDTQGRRCFLMRKELSHT